MSEPGSGERLTWLRPLCVPGTEFLVAHNCARGWHVFHERYEVCACRTAAASWWYRGHSMFLNDGSSMLMEPGETHRNTSVHKRSDFAVLFMNPEVFANAAEELGLGGTPHFRTAQVDDPAIVSAVYRFRDAVESEETLLEQQTRFAECVRLMLEYTEKGPRCAQRPHWSIRRVQGYLRERFREPVTLDELVAVSGLSRFHLAHVFAQQVGLPPHAYLLHVRIEHARRLLEQGVSAMGAAADVGFADQSHFTRHFKRVLGVTPREYAAAVR